MSTIEEVVRPKHAGAVLRIRHNDTEEYKNARKRNRNKIDLTT